jgi:hypothetical protein
MKFTVDKKFKIVDIDDYDVSLAVSFANVLKMASAVRKAQKEMKNVR